MTAGSMSAADAALLFDGGRLVLARQLAGLRKSDLATELGKSPTAVAAWESGTKRPSPATVAELSIRLSVDPAFFAVTSASVLPRPGTPHFRSLRSTTQLARDQAFAYGQLAADIATGLETHVEYPAVNVPTFPIDEETDDSPERAARFVRAEWALADGPVGHLVRLLENHGVLVIFSPMQTATVDAYSFSSQQRPVIVLNPLKRDYYRQRFDLAHELGHLVMHLDAEPGGRVVEDQANRFAAELLMPAADITALLPTSMSAGAWRTLGQLKEHWGVSMQALLFRARSLGVLGEVAYRNSMTTVSARGWRRSEPGQVQTLEQPSLLPRAVSLLQEEGFNDALLAAQCRAPLHLFTIATSRTPVGPSDLASVAHDAKSRPNVISLLPTSG